MKFPMLLYLVFIVLYFPYIFSEQINEPATYKFVPPEIGSISTFSARIPPLGVQISGSTRQHIELPAYVKTSSETFCTLSHSGIVNSTPFNIYYYPSKDMVSELAIEAAPSIGPTSEVFLVCDQVVVPQSVNDPVTYNIRVLKNKEVQASTVGRFTDMQPLGDTDIEIKEIRAQDYENDEKRRGNYEIVHSSQPFTLGVNTEFRFFLPPQTILSNSKCTVNGLPSSFAVDNDYGRVFISDKQKGGIRKNGKQVYVIYCTNFYFPNVYIPPTNTADIFIYNNYGDRISQVNEATFHGLTTRLLGTHITVDTASQFAMTSLKITFTPHSAFISEGDMITLLLPSNYDMVFYNNRTKCTMNNIRSQLILEKSSPHMNSSDYYQSSKLRGMTNITFVSPQSIRSSRNVVIQCTPVRNPHYINSMTATLRIYDHNTQGMRAVEDNIMLPSITYSIIGSEVATITPSSTIANTPPGTIIVTLKPIPVEIPEGSTIIIELPNGYKLQNRVLSHTTCVINTKDSKASSADIRGYTTYDVDLSRIEFNILTTIPESSSTIYMICDGVQVPKVTTKGQDNLTIIVMHDGLQQMQNDHVTIPDIFDRDSVISHFASTVYIQRNSPLNQKEIKEIENLYSEIFHVKRSRVHIYKMRLLYNIQCVQEQTGGICKTNHNTQSINTHKTTFGAIIPREDQIKSQKNANDTTYIQVITTIDNEGQGTVAQLQEDASRQLPTIQRQIRQIFFTKTLVQLDSTKDVSIPLSCSNNRQDPNETDTDCGGNCKQCSNGSTCDVDNDCLSLFCNSTYVCQASPLTDSSSIITYSMFIPILSTFFLCICIFDIF